MALAFLCERVKVCHTTPHPLRAHEFWWSKHLVQVHPRFFSFLVAAKNIWSPSCSVTSPDHTTDRSEKWRNCLFCGARISKWEAVIRLYYQIYTTFLKHILLIIHDKANRLHNSAFRAKEQIVQFCVKHISVHSRNNIVLSGLGKNDKNDGWEQADSGNGPSCPPIGKLTIYHCCHQPRSL